MSIGKACAIFEQIESNAYTDEEKGAAIHEVLKMSTHNSITKIECYVLLVIFCRWPL